GVQEGGGRGGQGAAGGGGVGGGEGDLDGCFSARGQAGARGGDPRRGGGRPRATVPARMRGPERYSCSWPGSAMALFWRHLEMPVEEIDGGTVGGDPMAMEQEVVDLVGKNELLDFDAAGA